MCAAPTYTNGRLMAHVKSTANTKTSGTGLVKRSVKKAGPTDADTKSPVFAIDGNVRGNANASELPVWSER